MPDVKNTIPKVAVIGAGFMGQNHLRVLRELDNIKIVSLAEKNNQLLEKTSSKLNISGYKDYKKMLNNELIDIVFIVIPTDFHYEVASFALEKGINVFVEKPFTKTIKQGKKLINLAKKKRLILGVGHIERFNPVITALRKHLDSGKIGKVFQITIRRIGPYPYRVRDVGVFMDLATHDIDIMRYITKSEIVKVSASSSFVFSRDKEDTAVGTLYFKNNVLGVIITNWISPTKIREITINGEKGMFIANLITQDLYFYENNYKETTWESLGALRGMIEGDMTRIYISRDEPLKLELSSFIDSVIEGIPFLVSGEDGLDAVRIATKLMRNASLKQRPS